MTATDRYLRAVLHVLAWWSIGLGIVSGIILACALVDLIGDVEWGYPWYSLPLIVDMLGLAVLLRRLAKAGLRTWPLNFGMHACRSSHRVTLVAKFANCRGDYHADPQHQSDRPARPLR